MMAALETAPAGLPGALLSPRMAIGAVFLYFGLGIGLWGGSVAEVARQSSVSAETTGSAFVGFSVAGILGMAVAGRVGRSVSLKVRLLITLALAACCLVALFQVRGAATLVAGLFAFSFITACVDLIMNSEGIAVERDAGRPVLAGLHGLASLGLGCGAIAGSYLSVVVGLAATATAAAGVYGVAMLIVWTSTPNRGAPQAVAGGSTWFRPGLALIALSVIVGASIAGETASAMFSAQTLTSQAPALAAYAGAGATAFALFQAAVRLSGDRLRASVGDSRLLLLSLATTLLGFVVVTFSTSFAMTAAGFGIVGIGTACIVPCGFAMAAGMSARSATAAISMLAMLSSMVRIPAPLLYGVVAGASGFAPAFSIYALVTGSALVLALLTLDRRPNRRLA